MKELTHEDWMKNPTPRVMWVWDVNKENKVKRKVIYINKRSPCYYPVMATTEGDIGYEAYMHCTEIEVEKQRRMTNKELSWWLSEKPHRELKIDDYIYHDYDYKENEQDAEVTDLFLIRENGGEWREPLIEEE